MENQNYQNPGYQAPGYPNYGGGQQAPNYGGVQQPQQKTLPPSNHLVWSILVTLLCCWPFGIPAIVNSAKVDKLWFAGYHDDARRAAANAKKWCIVSAILGIIVIIALTAYYAWVAYELSEATQTQMLYNNSYYGY